MTLETILANIELDRCRLRLEFAQWHFEGSAKLWQKGEIGEAAFRARELELKEATLNYEAAKARADALDEPPKRVQK